MQFLNRRISSVLSLAIPLVFSLSAFAATAPIPGALPPGPDTLQGAPVLPPGVSAKDMIAKLPPNPGEIGITEKLGATAAVADLKFIDDTGKEVRFGDYYKRGKPVLLALIYFECPGLCNFVLNGLVRGLKQLNWTPGNEFELVAVSINPKEGAELAAKKKVSYLESYGRPQTAAGWHFLTGEEASIKKLASEVGFGYRYDEKEKEYAHSAALFVLTPEGRISRYLYGVDYAAKDLRLSLLEASGGKIGTVIDRIILFCYAYDPLTRRYSVVLFRVMQAASLGMTLLILGYLLVFWRRQRRESALLVKEAGA